MDEGVVIDKRIVAASEPVDAADTVRFGQVHRVVQ
jgi:hypothetical protein